MEICSQVMVLEGQLQVQYTTESHPAHVQPKIDAVSTIFLYAYGEVGRKASISLLNSGFQWWIAVVSTGQAKAGSQNPERYVGGWPSPILHQIQLGKENMTTARESAQLIVI